MNYSKINYAIIDQLLISGSNFLISLILARLMTPADYGLYVFAFTLLVLSIGLLNNAVCNPLNVLGAAKKGDDKKAYIYNLFVMYLIVSAFLTIAFFIGFLSLTLTNHQKSGAIFGTVGIILFFYLGHEFFRNALLTSIQIGHVLIIDILSHGSRMVFIGASIYVDLTLTPGQVLIFFGLTSLTAALCGAWFLNFKFWADRTLFNRTIIIKTWDYAKWTLADWVPFILSGQLDVYLITFLLGSAATGTIGACRNLVAPLTIILLGFMSFALPYYSKFYSLHGELKLRRSLGRFFSLLIVGVIIYLFLIIIFSSQILHILFGKFERFSDLVKIISLGMLLNYLFKPIEVYFRVTQRPKKIFIARSIAALVSSLACYPFIKIWGIEGAAWYSVLSQALMCVGLFILRARQLYKSNNTYDGTLT